MEKHEMDEACLAILKEELVPAMGCTEPIALAYAAAKAREVLGALPQQVKIEASGSIIKNVKSVIVPNTDGLKGIPAACAAGLIAGDAGRNLEVIASVSPEQRRQMREYLEQTPMEVVHVDRGLTFDLAVSVSTQSSSARVRIVNYHTNVVEIEKDGKVIEQLPIEGEEERGLTDHALLSMERILDFTKRVEIKDIEELLKRQMDFNMAIAEEGLRGDYGANIGTVLLKSGGESVANRAKALAAAGSDARMNGCEMPVIINCGSGNQGITCCVPVGVYARARKASEEELYRALALSNLTAIHLKSGIGRLSAYCGAVTAGAAAGAAIAYLCGGKDEGVVHTIVNALAVVSGMICDGAKASCAAKIASSVDAGILGYEMFKNGQQFYGGDGIIKKGVEASIRNIGRLGREGMRETNEEIIRMMIC